MSMSITAFTEGFFSYVQLHPTAFDDTEKTDLRALAKRTFENAEEAGFALAEFVERIQRSGKPEQTKIVQALFDQAIQRPLSAPPTEQSAEKQTRYETTPTETGILDPDSLAHIFSFLSLQTQGQVARLSHSCRDAMRLRRIFDLDPLYGSRFSLLFPLFGITLPPPNPSSSQVSAACKELLEKVTNILKDVKKSKALTDDEKKPFSTMDPLEIVHNPSLLHVLLHTAYEISLVSPFLEGRNDGPELPGSMTLEEKAETVRKHLKDNGNSYEKLSCKKCGMLCFPRELCSLQNLQKLKLSGNRLSTIPPEIGQLEKLRRLNLNNNHLTSLPEAIGQLEKLRRLNLNNNHLTSLPEAIGGLEKLRRLDLHNNYLISLSEEIGGLTQLSNLNLNNNHLTSLPEAIGQLEKLRTLNLNNNHLTSLPEAIGGLTQLSNLDLHNNHLASLPEVIGGLTQLWSLDLSYNHLASLPEAIGRFTQRIEIRLRDNPLTVIPKSTENIRISV